MNTTEIINSMKEHVAAAYTAVTGKNGTVPEQKNLSNLAAAIDSIQVGSSAENPYKAHTYSEMNGYRTKDYANAYVEYTGQRQFTRNQIQDSSMYDKLYFDFPRQIGWVETFDWDNPDSNWTSDGLLYKCIVLFNVTPTKISDNTTEEAVPFSVYQMTATRDSSDVQAGTTMYGIGFPSSFSWVSWGGTFDKEYSRTGYKLKITNVKDKYSYFIGDIISTTGEWSQIMDGTQFGYKHGTYKIDTNSNTVDNFQKLNLVLEDGGGGTARKTITNNYSYNLDSYYDYILKYSYEGKSSSILCKVGNYDRISGANQLYNVTSDGNPDGIFFSLDASCPLPYGWNAASIIDNFDLSNPKQSTSNKSVVGVSSNLYTLVGKTVTIEDISTAADMIYYTTLPSLSTPAAAADIVKGKQAIDAEGNKISGILEPVDNPYTAKNTTELLNYCNGKYENAIVKVEDLTKTVETEIAVGDTISKLYFNTSITPNFSNLNWSNPDYERDGILVINILQSEEHFNNGEEDISWDGITVRRYDCSNQDSANPYRYSLNFASWFTLWTDNEFLHANNPDFYPVPGWNYTGLKTLGWLGIKNNVFSINSLMGQAIHVKAMKSQDLWKSFVSSAQDAWESKYYKIGEPDKNVLTSPVSLTCRSGNSVDLAYTLKLDKNSQWVINLTLGNTTVNKVVKQTSPVLNGTSIGGSQTLVELDWTSGNTNGINVDFGNNETINLFIGDCMDFHDTNHQGQYNSSASAFIINYASSAASGYQLTINSITPMSSYDEYHYLAAQNTIVATASDIKKGKGAFNTNGEFVVGSYEGVVLPALTNEGTAADLAVGKQLISSNGEIITGNCEGMVLPTLTNEGTAADLVTGKQLINSSGQIVTGSYEGIVLPTLDNEGIASDLAVGKQLIGSNGEIVTGSYDPSNPQLPQLNPVSIAKSGNNINISNVSINGNFVTGYKVYANGELKNEQSESTFNLLSLDPNKYAIRVRAKGNHFNDSVGSNAVDAAVFNIVYNLTDINASINTAKITNGQTLSFILTPVTDKYLPLNIQIECNGQTLDYTYNDYSGAVNVSTIALEYGNSTQNTINITAVALDIPKLHAPVLSIDGDTLCAEPPRYATSLEYYANDTLFSTDTDLPFAMFDVVAAPDAKYGFELNSAGYYVSKNYHIQNSAALCKVIFNVSTETQVRLDCINSGESNYDYGIISQIDKTLTTSTNDDGNTGTTNVLKNFKGSSSTKVQAVTLTVPAGEHFIYIKYRKDGSSDNGNDTLQFKVNLL